MRNCFFICTLAFLFACSSGTSKNTASAGKSTSTPSVPATPTSPPPPSTPAPAPPPAAPLPSSGMSGIPMDSSIRIGKLANGMTYYIKANAKPENRAELRMALKAGSMQEDADQLGLAHFIEHMAFNGTANFSKNDLVNYLERMGSRFGPDLNAYTSFDETVYMLQVRTDDKDQFDKGLLILKDWSSGITFDNSEVDKERGVVISEWRSRLSANQRMQQKYLPFLYYNSRYADRLPIGEPEIVQNASYDVVKRFYADWYRPELMALFVVGNVDVDATEKQLTEMFGSIQAKAPARTKESNAVPAHDKTFAQVITDPEASNANIQVVYNHKYTKIKDLLGYRERLVENLYNRMLGTRLSDIAEEADPPFVYGYTGYGQDVGDLSTYSSYAMAAPKDVRRAYVTLLEENQRVLQHGFTQGELDREKANVLRQAEQSKLEEAKLESNRVVQRLINHYLDDTPLPDAGQHYDMYASMLPTISLSEVSQLAKKWITNTNRVVIITGPEKDKAMYPDSVELIKLMNDISKKSMDPYEDVDVSAPLLTGNFPPQMILQETHNDAADIYHWSFPNGVKVSAKPTTFKNDEILMNAYSNGGHSLYGEDLYPSARSASSVVGNSGVGAYNSTGLEKKLAGKRVTAYPFISERYEGMYGNSSVQDLELLMQLTYSYLKAYREDTAALSSYLSRERAMVTNAMSNPNNWYYDRVARLTSQNHPRRGIPSLDSYDEVSLEDIMFVYQDRFKDVSDMHFFFVGSFNIDSLKKVTSKYLGALSGGGRTEMWKDVGDRYPDGKIDSVFHRGEAPRSQVQMIYHGPDQFDTDSSYLFQSLIEVARIKLREELREDKGGVYGVNIGGGLSKYPIQQYSVQVSFNADPPRTQELIAAATAVLEKMKMTIDTGDIAKVIETQRQGRIKDLEQNQFWMSNLVGCWINGTGINQAVQLDALEKRMTMLTPENLQRAARQYFAEQNRISAVMYPENYTKP